MTPKWPWMLKGQKYPLHVLPVPMSPKMHSVLLYSQSFSDNFDKSAPNDPKMTFNARRSKVPTYVLLVPASPIIYSVLLYSERFSRWLQDLISPLTTMQNSNVDKSAPNDPKMTLNGQRYPMYTLLVTPSPKFYSVLLYGQSFSSYRLILTNCTEWPQNDLEC